MKNVISMTFIVMLVTFFAAPAAFPRILPPPPNPPHLR